MTLILTRDGRLNRSVTHRPKRLLTGGDISTNNYKIGFYAGMLGIIQEVFHCFERNSNIDHCIIDSFLSRAKFLMVNSSVKMLTFSNRKLSMFSAKNPQLVDSESHQPHPHVLGYAYPPHVLCGSGLHKVDRGQRLHGACL